MVDLTIGHVSGIIAAVVFIVRIVVPSASTLVLAGILKDQNTATTWSVVARGLQSTHWPTLLRTDSQTSVSLPGIVRLERTLRSALLLIVSAASIITPLGLYDVVLPSNQPSQQPFSYATDATSFGVGTPSRSNLFFNRNCQPYACPGSGSVVVTGPTLDGTNVSYPNGYDITIPLSVFDAFQSGLSQMSRTVSSMWDIQWRSYSFRDSPTINNGSTYIVGAYRQLATLVLNNAIQPIEGLIADTVSGGVGFRNHTIPSPLPYGGAWSEDLLWIEPETVCVDMNITLRFRLTTDQATGVLTPADLTLVDEGGFANLIQVYPEYDHADPQSNIDLRARAYKAAWLSNVFTMAYLNVTNPREGGYDQAFVYLNSHVGKEFPLTPGSEAQAVSYQALQTSTAWGGFLNIPILFNSNGSVSLNSSASFGNNASNVQYPNPFKISTKNFTDIQILCQGTGPADLANITNVGVACGMMYGAAVPRDGGDPLVFKPNGRWSLPLYSCASAAKASIKTVGFTYNGTNGLESLKIASVSKKSYSSPQDMPLWGVENTQLPLNNVRPMWGLVSNEYNGRDDISVLQQEALWLPGYLSLDGAVLAGNDQNLPATDFATDMLGVAYELNSLPLEAGDYTGSTSLALYRRWQELSANATSASEIVNLIWTDLSANAVLGTRSWLTPQPTSRPASGPVKRATNMGAEQVATDVGITVFSKVVRYKWPFAIPAFIALCGTAVVGIVTLCLFITGHARPSAVRKYLNYTSVGRVLTAFVYPGQSHPHAPTKQWAAVVGGKRIDLAGPVPRAVDPVMMQQYGGGEFSRSRDSLVPKTEAGVKVRPAT